LKNVITLWIKYNIFEACNRVTSFRKTAMTILLGEHHHPISETCKIVPFSTINV